jgi:hypothetical protein
MRPRRGDDLTVWDLDEPAPAGQTILPPAPRFTLLPLSTRSPADLKLRFPDQTAESAFDLQRRAEHAL